MKALLVVYDNDSYVHYFPLGIAYIAAIPGMNSNV